MNTGAGHGFGLSHSGHIQPKRVVYHLIFTTLIKSISEGNPTNRSCAFEEHILKVQNRQWKLSPRAKSCNFRNLARAKEMEQSQDGFRSASCSLSQSLNTAVSITKIHVTN